MGPGELCSFYCFLSFVVKDLLLIIFAWFFCVKVPLVALSQSSDLATLLINWINLRRMNDCFVYKLMMRLLPSFISNLDWSFLIKTDNFRNWLMKDVFVQIWFNFIAKYPIELMISQKALLDLKRDFIAWENWNHFQLLGENTASIKKIHDGYDEQLSKYRSVLIKS